jgi:hypothetical protein
MSKTAFLASLGRVFSAEVQYRRADKAPMSNSK